MNRSDNLHQSTVHDSIAFVLDTTAAHETLEAMKTMLLQACDRPYHFTAVACAWSQIKSVCCQHVRSMPPAELWSSLHHFAVEVD